jgi:hypothetical protein
MKRTTDTFMKTLLIDDLRNFINPKQYDDITVCRNSVDALRTLEEMHNEGQYIDVLWLDHDLGENTAGETDDIMPIIDYLAFLASNNDAFEVGKVYVHTSNPVGKKRMMLTLENYGYCPRTANASDHFTV